MDRWRLCWLMTRARLWLRRAVHLSSDPTNHLFVRVRFDFLDAPGVTIREQGLFVGTVTDEALPDGQRYFTPDELTDAGTIDRQSTVRIRQPSSRET